MVFVVSNQSIPPHHALLYVLGGFGRSYCYTVRSAIGIIMFSVCLSVCDSVHVAVRVGVQGEYLYERVSSRPDSLELATR